MISSPRRGVTPETLSVMTAEQISAGLEVMAFLLVTTDLYGDDRLLKMLKWFPGISARVTGILIILFIISLYISISLKSEIIRSYDPRLALDRFLFVLPAVILSLQLGILVFVAVSRHVISVYTEPSKKNVRYLLAGSGLFLVAKAIVFFEPWVDEVAQALNQASF
jgi:hypothetical protein